MKIILASASKRRIELLRRYLDRFEVKASRIDEAEFMGKYESPGRMVKTLALAKAQKIYNTLPSVRGQSYLAIGADTVISLPIGDKHKIIGKPQSKVDARAILNMLSGREHKVISGVAILSSKAKGKKITFTDTTQVYFKKLSFGQITEYLNTGLYPDRAGAYGIQDQKCDFVERYIGSYNNILGLPTEKLILELEELGIKVKDVDKGRG